MDVDCWRSSRVHRRQPCCSTSLNRAAHRPALTHFGCYRLGQSQVVSRQVLFPSAEDVAVSGLHVSVNFGAAVALSGRTAAIGIPHEVEEQSLPGPGRVGIYTKTKAGWIRTATLVPSNPNDMRLGRDLDLCGNLAVVAQTAAPMSLSVAVRTGAKSRESGCRRLTACSDRSCAATTRLRKASASSTIKDNALATGCTYTSGRAAVISNWLRSCEPVTPTTASVAVSRWSAAFS